MNNDFDMFQEDANMSFSRPIIFSRPLKKISRRREHRFVIPPHDCPEDNEDKK
jgi:hypothetical protein